MHRATLSVVLLWLWSAVLHAATPLVRSFESLSRAGAAESRAIAQDSRGFIWFAAESGLIRFDGQRAQRFAPDSRSCRALSVSAYASGVIAHDECGQLFAVDEVGEVRLLLPGVVGKVRAAASVGQRRFAVINNELMALESPDDALSPLGLTVVPEPFGFPRLLVGDGVLVLSSSRASWLLRMDGTDEPLKPLPLLSTDGNPIGDVIAVAGGGTQPLALLTRFPAQLYRAVAPTPNSGAAPRLSLLHSERNRGIGLAWRGARLWVSLDIKLLAFDDDELAISFAQDRELPSGGPLLVDAEHSLWIGSISRVLQLPEPDAIRLDRADGLVSAHGQAVLAEAWRGGDAVLALTWQGAHRLAHDRVLNAQPMQIYGTVCATQAHSWYATRSHWHLDSADAQLREPREVGDESLLRACVHVDGRDLAVSEAGLLERRNGSAQAQLLRASLRPDMAPGMDALAVLGDQLWLARDDQVCRLPLSEPAERTRCVQCPGARSITSLLVEDGQLLAAAPPLGIVRIQADACVVLSLEDDALGALPNGLAAASSEGFWAFSNQALLRLRLASGTQLDLLERIGQAQGLTQTAALSVVETAQALWVANIEGYTRIGRELRGERLDAPLRLAPLRARADGLALRIGQTLPAATRVVELDFAALSFKAPEQLRYRHRLGINGGDETWSAPSHSARLTLSNLQAGLYRIEVAAQRDSSGDWSAPEPFDFRVSSPWQHTLWGRILIALAVFAVPAIAVLMRYQKHRLLKRQRLQIAADLHDELGSELASVRVLTSLLERPGIDAAESAALLVELKDSSTAASANLRQLVTHMTLGSDLGQLLLQLNRLASRLCGETLRSSFALDEVSCKAVLRDTDFRQLLLLGSEALTNIARHAQATAVHLHAQLEQGRLSLAFIDDGCGFDASATAATGAGNGLRHLQQRARALRARLRIDSSVGRGTQVRIELRL